MSFNTVYIKRFFGIAQEICDKYVSMSDGIHLGKYHQCPYPNEAIIEVIEVWVRGIDKLISLSKESLGNPYADQIRSLYAERGITYDEFYYLFSDKIEEQSYMQTPAYIFTKTYNEDLRRKKFSKFEYSPSSFREFILSLSIVPVRFLNASQEVKIPRDIFNSHSYLVAKTRSGKTELLKLIIHGLIDQKEKNTSLLILDAHGDFSREVKRFRNLESRIDDFVYLDPTLHADYSPVFNPFDINSKDLHVLTYATDTMLVAFEQLIKDQSITGNMRRLLRHCIYALLYHDNTSMLDLLDLLQAISRNRNSKNPDFTEHEKKLMQYGATVTDPLTQRFFTFGWKEIDSRTVSAVVERVDGILSHPLVRRFVVGGTSFDLESLLNTGKTVVVNLDFTKLGGIGSEAIGRLFVSQAQNISAKRGHLPRNKRPRSIVFIDECQRFISPVIEQALSEFAKFNSYLFLAHQFIEQVDDKMIRAMLSNTDNKLIGRNSASSMSVISMEVGIEKSDLLALKKYEFYAKLGDEEAIKFRSSDMLVDGDENKHYITEEEAHERIDPIMLKQYYRKVSEQIQSSSLKSNPTIQDAPIILDDCDF